MGILVRRPILVAVRRVNTGQEFLGERAFIIWLNLDVNSIRASQSANNLGDSMADLEATYRKILEDVYDQKRKANPRYSRTSFARMLGVDPTYLSKLRSGKILLSLDIAEKITKKLNFSTEVRTSFLLSAADEQRCHALYLIDASLTDCDRKLDRINDQPRSRTRT